MTNSLTNEIWTNDKGELFQVINFFANEQWANRVRIFENEALGRAYWLEDEEATNYIVFQTRVEGAANISEKLAPGECKEARARFFRAQRNHRG